MGQCSLKAGSRGFVVADLQRHLGISADGMWGPKTTAAVKELQRRAGLAESGCTGEAEYRALGVAWPGLFLRAMNFVSNLEGTGFGDCNATDIDGAGLTMGIAGFTTAHGEVQKLIRDYVAKRPQALNTLSKSLRDRISHVMSWNAEHYHWARIFYGGDGRVDKSWHVALRQWGQDPGMQKLQLDMAETRFWKRAARVTEHLGFKSDRAYVFFLDVAVQNGGWRPQHEVTVQKNAGWKSPDEVERLRAAAEAVADCAKSKWRRDVLIRKMAIARGEGVVHGRLWRLGDHGLM